MAREGLVSNFEKGYSQPKFEPLLEAHPPEKTLKD